MDTLRIRAYNVRFGDAYLISIPDKNTSGVSTLRHILIDVGNALAKEGGHDDVFEHVVTNIIKELDGKPLDLYIMTHEHMDHVQGLNYANENNIPGKNLKEILDTQFAWLTGSSEDNYYDTHPEAKRQFNIHQQMYYAISSQAQKLGLSHFSAEFQTMLFNNNPRRTKDNVDFLKDLAPESQTYYVHRGFSLQKGEHHNFEEAEFELLAPEEDTSEYYGRFKKNSLGVNGETGDQSNIPSYMDLIPPVGVDAGSFYKMLQKRSEISENLLAIDKATNNTSIVFTLAWRGWTLLFPGDAEIRSWKTMDKYDLLKPVDFLKVSHHGSHNGTPKQEILDKFWAESNPSRKKVAVVSTYENQYSNVPDQSTLDMLRDRSTELHELHTSVEPGEFIDIEFEG